MNLIRAPSIGTLSACASSQGRGTRSTSALQVSKEQEQYFKLQGTQGHNAASFQGTGTLHQGHTDASSLLVQSNSNATLPQSTTSHPSASRDGPSFLESHGPRHNFVIANDVTHAPSGQVVGAPMAPAHHAPSYFSGDMRQLHSIQEKQHQQQLQQQQPRNVNAASVRAHALLSPRVKLRTVSPTTRS